MLADRSSMIVIVGCGSVTVCVERVYGDASAITIRMATIIRLRMSTFFLLFLR